MSIDLLTQADAIGPLLRTYRRHIHSQPEVGFELPETKEYVRAQLETMGYSAENCGKCGLTATLEGAKPGKTFLLRADMDALPIREEADVDYAARNGNMHACGHDLHTAMLLGAAKLLMDNRQELEGNVKFMFQPAEEILSGAKDMIADGALEGVDAAAMIHVAAGVPLKAGTVIVAPEGISAPGAAYFSIQVQGKGCHGAAPYQGVDALSVAAHILLALHQIHARELPAASGSVLTVGHFSGGGADNAIADSAVLRGTVRAFEDETMDFLKKRIENISRGIAASFRAEAAVTFSRECPALKNDGGLCKLALDVLPEALGQNAVFSAGPLDKNGVGGSEDFAYVSRKVPSVMLSLAAGSPEEGHTYPLHHPGVTFDEDALPVGAAALAALAISYLSEG